jgi:hypothetical protein
LPKADTVRLVASAKSGGGGFLSSFIFRPLVQEPISRLFYGIIDSDKPFFTMLFAGLGVLVAVEKVLWG